MAYGISIKPRLRIIRKLSSVCPDFSPGVEPVKEPERLFGKLNDLHAIHTSRQNNSRIADGVANHNRIISQRLSPWVGGTVSAGPDARYRRVILCLRLWSHWWSGRAHAEYHSRGADAGLYGSARRSMSKRTSLDVETSPSWQ